jgi:uncharacterized membrane protein
MSFKELIVYNKRNAKHRDYLAIPISAVSYSVIAFALAWCAYEYYTTRSLWLDEAALAVSLTNMELWTAPYSAFVEYSQSAPLLYLYIVKAITLAFGNSETTLRVFSLFSYLAMLAVLYRLCADALHIRHPLACVAFVACLPILTRYANEFKPYMCDCLAVLCVLYAFHLYDAGRIRAITLGTACE